MRLDHELEVARRLALRVGCALRSLHYSKEETDRYLAGPRSGVTIPDLIADDIIVSGLQAAFPRDAVCSEQMPISPGRFECDRLWLIDALDGTINFFSHGDEYAVSIGLAIRGQGVLGVVYNPARDELFAGAVAEPATMNGLPVNPTMADQLAGACIRTSPEWVLRDSAVVLPEGYSIRPIASVSYGLARVASGMDEGFHSLGPEREWSTCAGVALVAATGGGRASLQGGVSIAYNTIELTHPSAITATGPNLHELLDQALTYLPQRLSQPAA